MRYRWGFIDENENFTECFPLVDDGAAIDYSQQTGEVFYRAKLNGGLTFRFESFDDILAKGYNYEHKVELQWYDADNDTWGQVWRGRFALTDCEINYDLKTISVSPETLDRYTTILDKLEDEHNITKLAAKQQPVTIQIRPLCQFYALNDSKLVNYIGGNSWEASCDMTGSATIENDFHFRMISENFAISIKWGNILPSDIDDNNVAGKTITYSGTPDYSGSPRLFDVVGRYVSGYTPLGEPIYTEHKLECFIYQDSDDTRFSCRYYTYLGYSSQTNIASATFERDEAGTAAAITTISYVEDANAQWDKIYSRMLLNAEGDTYHGEPLYDLAADDMAGANLNYTKISRITPVGIQFYQYTQTEPTEWGLSYNDEYFIKPTGQLFPVGQGLWKYVSVWGTMLVPYTIFDDAVKNVRIRDCYMLDATAMRLLLKAGWTGQYWISRVLGGNNDYVGDAFVPVITPKSNVISSYYDSPAQNAPITLAKIFNLLKLAYKIYWYIDNNNNIHVEHISYFDNGYSYSEDEPELLVDLETDIHTNTRNNKVFGQNLVKFDKQDMPAQYTFGWGDVQTKTFDGFPLDMLDKYVSQGVTEEVMVGNFDTDVDFVLSSPNDVSKEGFFLFACPASGGVVSYAMTTEDVTYVDEAGDTIEVSVQNADAAFVKIHQSYWRYHLPCENIRVTNEDTNAITTGSFKLQSVEFADVVMAEILKDISNCNKLVRTQQGDGHIKTLSINLNSLTSKADLLFNFVGRWYYLRGTALGSGITITINDEQVSIEVVDNSFKHKYREPITSLTFDAADVVSVDFGDTDRLAELTSCDNMFDGCEELLAVDFDSKDFSAVTSADYMFRGCAALTTLICPPNSTWKADIDLSDCPSLTTDSLYQLIGFLYLYNSGVHTITPNTTMWNALDGAVQNDIIAKALAKGWTIAIPAQYSVTGTSSASTVYATINGNAIEIDVVGGNWSYDYNTPITSISFEGDANVQTIDFSLSDGLAGVTSLNDAFKGCTMLTSVDFTNCDLTNVVSASDCFANCGSLFDVTIPSNTWKSDVDFSTCLLITYAEMQDIIGGLYTYSVGTHTITWNTTYWNTLAQAQQQTISDAADAKGWTTNAVAVVYVIRGKSTAASESFTLQFIDDNTQAVTTETITCAVDAQGNFEHQYSGKKIYALGGGSVGYFQNNTTITSIAFTEDFAECITAYGAFWSARMQNIDLHNATFSKLTIARRMFFQMASLTTIDLSNATFENVTIAEQMFNSTSAINIISMPKATFAELTNSTYMFSICSGLSQISMPKATFAKVTDARYMFNEVGATTIDLSSATFAALVDARAMFMLSPNLTTIMWDADKLKFDNLVYMSQNTNGVLGMFTGDTNLSASTIAALNKQKFNSVQYAINTFRECTNITAIDLKVAEFKSLINAYGMFSLCNNLTTIDLSNATFENVTNTFVTGFPTVHTFYCPALETISVPASNSAIKATSTPSASPLNFAQSPLTYQSMLKIANWVSDLTGYNAHTCTFKATAWNALSSAEQNTIDTILSGKNWNRAIA